MNEEDNSNSITILNHKLTIADMIEQTYYNATMCNINNNTKRFNELYYTHLNEIDKQKWHNFMKQFYTEIDIINKVKPLFAITKSDSCNLIPIATDYDNIEMIEVDSHHHFWKKINVLNNLLKFKIQQERTIKIVRKETEYLNNKIKSLEKKLAILNFKYNEIVDNSTNLKNFIIRQDYTNNENRYERYYLWVIISLLLIGISNLYYHIIMSY
jgi:transcriptional regulator with GAF, ATPase, and Fis domain